MSSNSKGNKLREDLSGVAKAYHKNSIVLKNYLFKYLHNFHDVEDVAQEAFLKAYGEEKKTVIAQPKSFLFRIAKNIAISKLRLKSRQITDYINIPEDSDALVGDSLEDEAIARQKLGAHCEAVATLPTKCRRVYLLRKVYGFSHKEIAQHLSISVSTVEKHLIKGIALCDAYLRQQDQPEECGASSRSGLEQEPLMENKL